MTTRSRAYRWSEDGIGGICDAQQRLCLAVTLWNGRDSILKERMFGLTGKQGNHGEDVKEYFFYLDATPSHSFLRYLYKYPQNAFPYSSLVEENRRRSRADPPFNLLDTGIFRKNRYWDVEITYVKETADTIFIRIRVGNRGRKQLPCICCPPSGSAIPGHGAMSRAKNRVWKLPSPARLPGLLQHITRHWAAISCMAGNRQKACTPKTKRIWSGFLVQAMLLLMSRTAFTACLSMEKRKR
ncbi:MAG: hypothetical protein SCH71_12215 [Desulfobulbaceae bacterium]|nr:hypothetical protein [Desulfobulbaceae bacterium]